MLLKDKIKIALSSYKEDLISRDQAVEYLLKTLQNECETCSQKDIAGDLQAAMATIEKAIEEDSQCQYVPSALGVECTD